MNKQSRKRELPPALRRQLEHSGSVLRNPLHSPPRLLVSTASGLLFSSDKAYLSGEWVTFQGVTNHTGSMLVRLTDPQLFAQGVDIRIEDIAWCAEEETDGAEKRPSTS